MKIVDHPTIIAMQMLAYPVSFSPCRYHFIYVGSSARTQHCPLPLLCHRVMTCHFLPIKVKNTVRHKSLYRAAYEGHFSHSRSKTKDQYQS
jgi:hypothetical protein